VFPGTDRGAGWLSALERAADRRRQQLLTRRRIELVEHERERGAVVFGAERPIAGVRLVDDPHVRHRSCDGVERFGDLRLLPGDGLPGGHCDRYQVGRSVATIAEYLIDLLRA
jgi:hypothetical protein